MQTQNGDPGSRILYDLTTFGDVKLPHVEILKQQIGACTPLRLERCGLDWWSL